MCLCFVCVYRGDVVRVCLSVCQCGSVLGAVEGNVVCRGVRCLVCEPALCSVRVWHVRVWHHDVRGCGGGGGGAEQGETFQQRQRGEGRRWKEGGGEVERKWRGRDQEGRRGGRGGGGERGREGGGEKEERERGLERWREDGEGVKKIGMMGERAEEAGWRGE